MTPKKSSTDTNKKKSYLAVDDQDDSVIHKNKVGDYRSFMNLVSYTKEHRGAFIISFALILLTAVISILSARMMGEMVEQGLVPVDKDAAIKFALYVVALEVLALGTQWIGRKILASCSSETIYLIRQKLFRHLQVLPIQYYDRQPQGRIVTRITHDVEGVEEFFTSSLGRLISALFSAGIALIAMLMTDFYLGGILVLSTIPCVLYIYFTKAKMRHVNRQMSRHSSGLNAKLSEFLSGLDVIRSYGLEDWSLRHYNKSVDRYFQSQLNANMVMAIVQPMSAFLVSLPLIGLVGIGGQQVIAGTLSLGLFVTFVRYCERFFTPILMLAREVHVIQQAFTSAERVSSFLKEASENEVLGSGDRKDLFPLKGDIEFKNVWMSYKDENWVLKNLSFQIHAGEMIGLLGTTGCGKTTTVSLLSRLYEYQKGEILLDGVEIRDFDRDLLRSNIGFVSQDVIIFRGTLRENLTSQDLSEETILKACLETGLSLVMNKTGLRLDSMIYEGGSNLSIGERQLIALTRVMLNNPSLLILDEATANIDPFYESLIHQAVHRLMLGRTCLIIAHRLETIMSCQRLLVFEKGQLVEEGSPEALLLNQAGHFAKLHRSGKQKEPELMESSYE